MSNPILNSILSNCNYLDMIISRSHWRIYGITDGIVSRASRLIYQKRMKYLSPFIFSTPKRNHWDHRMGGVEYWGMGDHLQPQSVPTIKDLS